MHGGATASPARSDAIGTSRKLSALRKLGRYWLSATFQHSKSHYRESNDTPSENAFCRVAPRVRLSAFAIFAAGFFARADDFSSRTSCLVHSRRLVDFAMVELRFGKNGRCF
jgi:hypothetical protein